MGFALPCGRTDRPNHAMLLSYGCELLTEMYWQGSLLICMCSNLVSGAPWSKTPSESMTNDDKWKNRATISFIGYQTDCNSETSFEDDPETNEVSHFDFVRHDNTSEVCVQLDEVLAVPDLFSHDQDTRFQTVTLALLQWLSAQDREAASMRLVSLVEIYVGFRIFGYHKRPLSLGSDLQGPLSVVTFAADFRYFKKCFRWLCDRAMIPWKSGMLDLSEILIFTPQPAINLGWKGEVESTVLSALSDFIGHRPIRTAQGFSKPWHI